jgi:hypothetical protein
VRVSTRKTNCHYLLQHHESFSLPLIITIIAHPMDLLLSYNEQLKEEKMENKVQYSSHLRYKLWRFGAVDAINNRVSCLPTQHSHMAHRTFQWSYWLFLLPRSNKFVRDWDSKAAVQRCRQQKKKDQEAPVPIANSKRQVTAFNARLHHPHHQHKNTDQGGSNWASDPSATETPTPTTKLAGHTTASASMSSTVCRLACHPIASGHHTSISGQQRTCSFEVLLQSQWHQYFPASHHRHYLLPQAFHTPPANMHE